MTGSNKVLYIIPARGGSKGVPGKNIKPLRGKPLIYYAIDVARALAPDDDICVSTDDETIKRIVEQSGLKVPFLRPNELSTDQSGMHEVLLHALNYFKQQGKDYRLIILLQPTSPFRKVHHIKQALESWSPGTEMVVGVKTTKANPYYVLFEENDQGFLVKSKPGTFKTRQESPVIYEINGAVYVIDVDCLRTRPMSAFERIKKYVMDEASSLDIDTPLDWKFAEFLLAESDEEKNPAGRRL